MTTKNSSIYIVFIYNIIKYNIFVTRTQLVNIFFSMELNLYTDNSIGIQLDY